MLDVRGPEPRGMQICSRIRKRGPGELPAGEVTAEEPEMAESSRSMLKSFIMVDEVSQSNCSSVDS